MSDSDDVLRAVSDPTRRQILAMLGGQPGLTTGQIADRVAGITRWGVIKHLAVLREAGLVQTFDEGRRRRHYRELGRLRSVLREVEQELAD
jgi:DNA-binding transcriptional ArsR family regulator